jgi:hypothetical protein
VAEWPAFSGQSAQYSPRLDLAVGPFATRDGLRLTAKYSELSNTHRQFLMRAWEAHALNEARLEAHDDQSPSSLDEALAANRNARCFIAIEIENEVSRKHLMGGAINATALGHLGIFIGWTDAKVTAMFRVRRYLNFLRRVDKPGTPSDNLLIISRDQALTILAPD